jgi:hypothetical protein
MSFNELIIDSIEPEDNQEAMYIKPSRINTTKYLSQNIFDQATIRHSSVEQITSNGLSGIFSSLKPLGKINIIVHQPIGVMIFYDSKQIEANLKLAGFENIKISDIKYNDEITKHEVQTQEIEAEKPESKRNVDVTIEIKKTTYKEQKPITTYKEQKPFLENNKFISTKVTSSSKGDYNNSYKPKGNKTYVKKEMREEIVEEKKEEIIEKNRPKNRTYVREQKEEKVENKNQSGGGKGYFRRRFRGEKEN